MYNLNLPVKRKRKKKKGNTMSSGFSLYPVKIMVGYKRTNIVSI